MYPNPTSEFLYIDTPKELGLEYIIELYDFRGRKVITFEDLKFINISVLAPSNYKILIKYKTGEKWSTIINKR